MESLIKFRASKEILVQFLEWIKSGIKTLGNWEFILQKGQSFSVEPRGKDLNLT